ncbi:MAG: protein-glutamate O-methyltransferase [Desulfuromonadales bacterium]|nr:protein-glutamate O-methyltransferase [Desulfuromonadales bacterium]
MLATDGDNLGLDSFKDLMLRTCGLSFGREREKTLANGLHRRMSDVGIASQHAYHNLLVSDQAEFNRLVELLTVNETYFCREPDHLKLMINRLAPEIMASRPGPVKILSAGCSTGEEPYSVAIMLRERYGDDCQRLFSIAGVDIDAGVIGTARRGIYGRYSFRGLESCLQERYFEPFGPGEYRICDAARSLVQFDTANLLGAPYPQIMMSPDIILYRNVSIYFPDQVQRTIFSRLAELLNDGGYLIVGATETIHHDVGILTLVERDSLYVFHKRLAIVIEERRRTGRGQASAGLPGHAPSRPLVSGKAPVRSTIAPQPPRRTTGPAALPTDSGRTAGSLFDEAQELARTDRGDNALPILEALVTAQPSFIKAQSLKACVLLSASRFAEARATCEDILTRDTLCLEGYLILGIIAQHDGNRDEAYRRFREALYLDASCWPAQYYLAGILFSRGDVKRAKIGYETALRFLENGSLCVNGRSFFPLSFKAEQFITVCRHKLSLLKEKG